MPYFCPSFFLAPIKPRLSSVANKEHFKIGDTATLTCASIGADNYTFFIGATELGSGYVTSYTIDNFAISDDGMYTCVGRNGAGESESSDVLKISLSKYNTRKS